MNLRRLLVLSLLAVVAVMTVPAVYAVGRAREVRRIALDLREEAAQSALAVGLMQAGLARLDRYQRAYVVTGDPDLGRRSLGALRQLELHVDRLIRSGYGDVAASVAFPVDSLRTVTDNLITLMEAGRLEEATASLSAQARPLIERAEDAAVALATALDRATAEQIERADRITASAVTATTTALAGALLVSLALAVIAIRLVCRPLVQLSGSMSTVASGRFEPPTDLPYERDDELGELSRSFRAMTLRLADLDRMKADFVGVASHDLKTPISVISGYAEMLRDELDGTVVRRHQDILRALVAQARTLGRRMEQLLEISRMEASGLRLGLEEISIRHFTASLEKAHAPAAGRHRIAFATAVAETAPSFVIADPDCLRTEVLGNLLENAFRFTPPGGAVHLHVSGQGGKVVFEVRDSGQSIPPDDLPFVFDRYYQGRGRGRVGSGLGLPIARAGVVAHGGDIEVGSGAGETVFRVVMPIHPSLTATPELAWR